MINVLMTSDGEHESFAGTFTSRELLDDFILKHPLPVPMSYFLLESIPDQAGVARRIDLAVEMVHAPGVIDVPSALEGSPIEFVAPEGSLMQGQWAPVPFSVEVFGKDHNQLLRVFETPSGQLEAQFRPGDLTEACETFVRELQRLHMGMFGAS